MGWNRKNWKTTTLGVLKGLIVIAPMVAPSIAPVATAAYALADSLFGFFTADATF